MQITRKQLRQLISEEVEKVSEEGDALDNLIEGYAEEYGSDEEYVSKQALIDFLEVMEESKIPREAFESFMQNIPENTVTNILREALKKD